MFSTERSSIHTAEITDTELMANAPSISAQQAMPGVAIAHQAPMRATRALSPPGLGLTPAQPRARGQALWTPSPLR